MASFFNNYLFIILALLAGIAMPTQASVNGKMTEYVGNPIAVAFISFTVGTIALFIYILVSGISLNSLMTAKNAPPVAWIGGICGAFFVSVMAASVPRIGVALAFSVAISGQMIATLLIDHFGWLGMPERPINLPRVGGAALIIVGVILIRKF